MTIKNFKVGQGLDLDGLILTNGNGELLVNGNAIAVDLAGYATETYVANALTPYATQSYVANAIANSTVDLAPAAGNHIDWNAGTSQFDANVTTIAFDLVNYHNIAQANALPTYTFANALANDGLNIGYNPYYGVYGIDIDYGTVATTLVNNWNIAQSNAYPTYDTANVLAGYGLTVGINPWYGSYGIDVDTSIIATTAHVANAISNLVDSAPETLNTLNELAAALQDNPNVITSLQNIASGKQNALIEGLGIDIVGNTISTNMPDIANAIAGSYLDYNTVAQAIDVNVSGIASAITGTGLSYSGTLDVNTAYIANAIAGTGITYNTLTQKIEAAPGYISNVTPTFVVTNGQLALSDAITISSVELKDSVANVTAASDVFGNGSISTYSMGSAVTIGTLPTGAEVADVFVTLKAAVGASTFSRTSKLTYVNTGGDAPTWTEYGIIVSGSFPATTISFDSSGNIIANVTGSDAYSAKGVVTILK